MRTMHVGIVAALAFFIVVDETEAQQYSGAGRAAGTDVSGPISGGVAPVVTTFSTQGQVMPYSYWVSTPKPARIYVEYGAIDQFPFQGRAYGNPSDRWSWYYMGGGDSRYLAKYYYPPLR
ncbi:MAG: hypothetical protein ACXWO1_17075 [Isosphaeraceae bacterium]